MAHAGILAHGGEEGIETARPKRSIKSGTAHQTEQSCEDFTGIVGMAVESRLSAKRLHNVIDIGRIPPRRDRPPSR